MTISLESVLGILVSVLLAILTGQIRGTRKDTQLIATKLDSHILSMTEKMAAKMDVTGCGAIRRDCVELNKKIILAPLAKALEDVEDLRKESWDRQRLENKSIWYAIRGHSHTEIPSRERDKVLLPTTNGAANGVT